MKINVGFAIYTDVVEFEPFLGEKISKYKKAFDKWYYEIGEIGGIKIKQQRADLPYKYFNTQVILDWMLEVAPNCNAHIVEARIPLGQEDNSLPGLYF